MRWIIDWIRCILIFVRRDIKTIEIPSFITRIGVYAFANSFLCNALIGTNVSEILEGAFYNCRSLQFVEILPDSKLKKIGQLAFCKTSLQLLMLPSSVSTISNNWCDNETKIIYDEKVKEVDKLLLSNNNIPTTLDNNKELTDSKSELQKTKILCYRRKDVIFSPTILKSKQQHHKVPIIPEDKEAFSDFIIFTISSYPTFITSTPVKSSVPGICLTLTSIPDIKIDKNIPDYQKSSYSIRVEFD